MLNFIDLEKYNEIVILLQPKRGVGKIREEKNVFSSHFQKVIGAVSNWADFQIETMQM